MYQARLTIDLPSETLPPPSAVKKAVAWVLGKKEEADENLERLLVDNLTFFEGFLRAFGAAGFDDVVSVIVDGRPVYVDTEEKVGDLQEALVRTAQSGAFDDGFSILRVTVCRQQAGMRVLAELRANARVEEGTPEVTIRVSAREDDLDLAEGEGPREYAARMRQYIRDTPRLDSHRAAIDGLVESIVQAVSTSVAGATTSRGPVILTIVACGPRQVGRMRHLSFGRAGRRTVYSALPDYERTGAYDDPLTHHYYSAYQDLFDWIALGEVLAGHWSSPHVHVLHPTGRLLMTGEQGPSYDQGALEVPRDAVRVNAEGRLVVDASIPHVDALDFSETGSPQSVGWGGEEWLEADGDG